MLLTLVQAARRQGGSTTSPENIGERAAPGLRAGRWTPPAGDGSSEAVGWLKVILDTGWFFAQYFNIGGTCLCLYTNDCIISQEANRWLKYFVSPKGKEGIRVYLLSMDDGRHLPLEIPKGANAIYSGHTLEYFLHKQYWLVDLQHKGRLAIDDEHDIVVGFIYRSYFLKNPWVLETLLYPVFELLKKRGLYLVHAGAVSLGNRGLLLPGRARSGKTTFVLHLVREGFEFLSDDRCFLRKSGSDVEMLSFPEQVRVYLPNVFAFPEFQFLQEEHDGGQNGKVGFEIERVYPDRSIDRCDLAAVVFPRWAPTKKSMLETIPPPQALVELLPLTLETFFPETTRSHFRLIGDLVQTVPCFSLYMGSDSQMWCEIVKGLLQEL
ncbi:MAG: hypothetical protein FJZ94_04110 [Chloroflexi bacterium]|nr:hypothetical protein [Chloroflexota bacterium]MBM3166613.1 hypothetical protein [Chloroflexota bacterium]